MPMIAPTIETIASLIVFPFKEIASTKSATPSGMIMIPATLMISSILFTISDFLFLISRALVVSWAA